MTNITITIERLEILLGDLHNLGDEDAALMMRHLERVHYSLRVDRALIPDDPNELEDLGVLDSIRGMISVVHRLPMRSDDEIHDDQEFFAEAVENKRAEENAR